MLRKLQVHGQSLADVRTTRATSVMYVSRIVFADGCAFVPVSASGSSVVQGLSGAGLSAWVDEADCLAEHLRSAIAPRASAGEHNAEKRLKVGYVGCAHKRAVTTAVAYFHVRSPDHTSCPFRGIHD